jgi:hypothetical protein
MLAHELFNTPIEGRYLAQRWNVDSLFKDLTFSCGPNTLTALCLNKPYGILLQESWSRDIQHTHSGVGIPQIDNH